MPIKNDLAVFLPIMLTAWKAGASYATLYKAAQGFNIAAGEMNDTDMEWLAQYRVSDYPLGSYCICGIRWSGTGLKYHCHQCEGKHLMGAPIAGNQGTITLQHWLANTFWLSAISIKKGLPKLPLPLAENILIEYLNSKNKRARGEQ